MSTRKPHGSGAVPGTIYIDPEGNATEAEPSKLRDLWNKLINTRVGSYMYEHPLKSAGLGIGGAANIAGLFDNDKVLGQLLGAGAGVGGSLLANKFLGANLSNPAIAGITMGAGALGSFFDKLRAKKDANAATYAQNPNTMNGMVQLLPNDNSMYVTPEESQRVYGGK